VIEADGQRAESKGNSLTIVPPGESRITVRKAGIVVRVFSKNASDLATAAKNAAIYADGAPEVTPITTWPDPVGGFRLRHYDLNAIASPDPSPLKMRVFRSTNLMINIFMPSFRHAHREILCDPRVGSIRRMRGYGTEQRG
jgi:hypothetical protein